MNIEEHLLFEKDLLQLRDEYKQLMSKEIQGYDKDYILSIDIDEVSAYLANHCGFDIPVLSDKYEVLELTDVTVTRRRTDRAAPRHNLIQHSGTKVEYVIPFTGNAFLFDYRTDVRGHRPMQGSIVENELHLSYLVLPSSKDIYIDEIRSEFEGDLDEIKKYLDWNRQDAEIFNGELGRMARSILQSRKDNFIKLTKFLTDQGIRIRRRDNAPDTFKAPVERRKLPIRKPGSSPLPMEEYEHILYVMTSMASVMERSPKAFAKIGEEDLRIHFLVQLNGQYEGQATGETFNLGGKTDILIRIANQNIFVAECKYWTGEKGFLDALVQLFGYLTWRDTKAAIALFNKSREPTKVVRQIPSIIRKHESFIELLPYESDSGSRFRLHHPEDSEKEVLLTVLVFNVPN
jgi:hypothetical protein